MVDRINNPEHKNTFDIQIDLQASNLFPKEERVQAWFSRAWTTEA